MYILGIDCGGTSSEALLIREDGSVLGHGQGGPANFTMNGVRGVVASALAAAQGCLQKAQVDFVNLQRQGLYLALGVSGAGREPERMAIKQALENKGFTQVVVGHDAEIALLGALSGADGVVVIAGTGSIAYGLSGECLSRVGGWGYLLGDEGSAFWIALRALQRVMQGYDGRAEKDPIFLGAAQAYFQVTNPEELVPLIYKTPLDRGFIGGFSAVIAALADEGHPLAQEILSAAGRQLGQLAIASLTELGLLEAPGRVGACGGVFSAGSWILTPMEQEIQQAAPKHRVTLPDFKPVIGAVFLAARHFNLDLQRLGAGLTRNFL